MGARVIGILISSIGLRSVQECNLTGKTTLTQSIGKFGRDGLHDVRKEVSVVDTLRDK